MEITEIKNINIIEDEKNNFDNSKSYSEKTKTRSHVLLNFADLLKLSDIKKTHFTIQHVQDVIYYMCLTYPKRMKKYYFKKVEKSTRNSKTAYVSDELSNEIDELFVANIMEFIFPQSVILQQEEQRNRPLYFGEKKFELNKKESYETVKVDSAKIDSNLSPTISNILNINPDLIQTGEQALMHEELNKICSDFKEKLNSKYFNIDFYRQQFSWSARKEH